MITYGHTHTQKESSKDGLSPKLLNKIERHAPPNAIRLIHVLSSIKSQHSILNTKNIFLVSISKVPSSQCEGWEAFILVGVGQWIPPSLLQIATESLKVKVLVT